MVRAQASVHVLRLISGSCNVQSVPKTRAYVPLKIVGFVTGLKKAESLSVVTGCFAFKRQRILFFGRGT